ncbi:hypothetical protein L0244_24670, partial [bacterium]|nr:hypothetical protein [bacterium]
AITGAGNTALGGGGFGSIVQNGFIGGFSALAGGYGGQVGSKLGGVVINGTSINSPFLSGLIGGGLGGAGGGFAGGFTGSLLTGGNFNNALTAGLSSARSGFAVGAPIGAGAASIQAHRSGRDPFSGKTYNSPSQAQPQPYATVSLESPDDLIALGELSGTKKQLSNAIQYTIDGDQAQILDQLIQKGGGTPLSSSNIHFRLQSGAIVGGHISSTTGVSTIDINIGGKIYKFRIIK